MKTEKTEKTTNPATVAANELKEVVKASSFGAETEAVQGEVISHAEAVSAMAENFAEDESVFESKISAFGPKLQAQSRALRNAMKSEAEGRLSQARILYAIDSAKLLKGTSYKGLGEYAEDVFGMKKSQASKLKNAYARFYATPLTTSAGYQLKLSPAQSEELLAANDDDIQAMIDSGEITDEMTSREIREAIKARKPIKEAQVKIYRWKPVMFTLVADFDGEIAFEEGKVADVFMHGNVNDIFTSTEELLHEIAEKGGHKVYMKLTGSNFHGEVVEFVMDDLSVLTYLKLGEVKPEKKGKKTEK